MDTTEKPKKKYGGYRVHFAGCRAALESVNGLGSARPSSQREEDIRRRPH